jgi:hypothetical protein
MGKLGFKERIAEVKKEHVLDHIYGIFPPDELVYKTLAELFHLNGFVIGLPPRRSDLAEGRNYRYRFFLHLCGTCRKDLEWINDYFPGRIKKLRCKKNITNPETGETLKYHWFVRGMSAGLICDELIAYGKTQRDRHLLEQCARGTLPHRRGRGHSVPDGVRERRAAIMLDVNTLCSEWPHKSPTDASLTHKNLKG